MRNRMIKTALALVIIACNAGPVIAQPEVHYPETNVYMCWHTPCPDEVGVGDQSPWQHCRDGRMCVSPFRFRQTERNVPCTIYGVAAPIVPCDGLSHAHSRAACTWRYNGTIEIYVYKATEGDSVLELVKYSRHTINAGKTPDRSIVINDTVPEYERPMGRLFLHEFWFDEPLTTTGTLLIGIKGSADYGDDGMVGINLFGLLTNLNFTQCEVPGYYAAVNIKKQQMTSYSHAVHYRGNVYVSTNIVPDVDQENIKTIWGQFYFPIMVPRGSASVTEAAAASAVRLTPNPARTEVTVEAGSPVRAVEAVDMVGRTVLRKVFPGGESRAVLDISRLPQGCYALRVSTPQGTLTEKLVVE